MGKSNKFDYTNRSNSGTKLGQIIGAALQKEADKVRKDAEKQRQKLRKQSTSSAAALPEAEPTTHAVDLKVPNKNLGDDGLFALADGLQIALEGASGLVCVALEELSLSANNLTTSALARLAPIIVLAKDDLSTLDLCENTIKVESSQEAAEWEKFLQSISYCSKLQRLDLSGNLNLGRRALEVFARVCIAEQGMAVDTTYPMETSLSLFSTYEDADEGCISPMHNPEQSSMPNTGLASISRNTKLSRSQHGLSGIPYVKLHNIGLDDAGSLWLSYAIENQPCSTLLVSEHILTQADGIGKTHEQDISHRQLDWVQNPQLGRDGAHLLEKTDVFRRQVTLVQRADSTGLIGDADSALGIGGHDRRKSTERRSSRVLQCDKRSSNRSNRTTDDGEHEATELESARKKIMRQIIAHDGATSVELWAAVLKYFRASRILLYIAPASRSFYFGESLFPTQDMVVPMSPTVQPATPTDKAETTVTTAKPRGLAVDTAKANNRVPKSRETYASKLAATKAPGEEPERVLTDVTNTPTTPLRLQKPTHRKGAFSKEDTDLQVVSRKLNALVTSDSGPHRFAQYQQSRLVKAAVHNRMFRDTNVNCHLPRDVVEHIMTFIMTDKELSMMHDDQRRAAFQWSQNRESLKIEREWVKKDESAQVLMLLDSINCLAYVH